LLACLLVVVRRFRRRRCTDVVVCCTVISGHEGTAETEVRSTDSAAVRTDRSSLSSPLQCIITKIVHCLSKTVIVTVNVEECEGTSVHQQCQSSAGIGGPRWYVQPQKMIVLKKCWLPEHSVGCEPHYIVVARLQPSAANMAEYHRPLVDCQQVSI